MGIEPEPEHAEAEYLDFVDIKIEINSLFESRIRVLFDLFDLIRG